MGSLSRRWICVSHGLLKTRKRLIQEERSKVPGNDDVGGSEDSLDPAPKGRPRCESCSGDTLTARGRQGVVLGGVVLGGGVGWGCWVGGVGWGCWVGVVLAT